MTILSSVFAVRELYCVRPGKFGTQLYNLDHAIVCYSFSFRHVYLTVLLLNQSHTIKYNILR